MLFGMRLWKLELDDQGQNSLNLRTGFPVRQVADTDLLSLLKNELDHGEAEAIALAKEIKAKLILLDERDARRIAKSLGLTVLGTVGILIQAKHTGKIASLQATLDLLMSKAQFRISDSLYNLALRTVGEV